MSKFSEGEWVSWNDELCYISNFNITGDFARLVRKSYDAIYVSVKELSKPESKKETKNMQNKQVNLGDVVKAEFNGTEADGVVTWVSSCAKVVIFQQQDTGHIYWTDVDNLIEVNSKWSVMQEQEFKIGDNVVVNLTSVGYTIGEIISVDYYHEEGKFYYEVDFADQNYSDDFESEELYDLEGLEYCLDKQQDENVKVIDEVSMGVYLVIDDYGNVYELAGYHLAEKRSAEVENQDSIIEELRDLLQQRSETGIRKYGTTLDRTDLNSSEWCQHLLEELLDAAGYVLRLKKDLEALEVQ